jgi:hypothetical protein
MTGNTSDRYVVRFLSALPSPPPPAVFKRCERPSQPRLSPHLLRVRLSRRQLRLQRHFSHVPLRHRSLRVRAGGHSRTLSDSCYFGVYTPQGTKEPRQHLPGE